MKIRNSIFQSGLKLASIQGFVQISAFVRNVIVARIISPADYGIAALFALTFSLLEMISNLAADTLLIQAPDGDKAEFQETAQALHALRGFLSAAILLAIALPVSTLFGVPQAAWAFRCLALLPLLKAFIHLDLNRVQRDVRFGPQIVADSVSSLLSTLAALVLGLWFRDYSLMLWILMVQTGSFTILSHIVAERQYRWAWKREYVKRIATFGWPLLINGLLMYVIFQGDQFIIGTSRHIFRHSAYSLADLGGYSVAFGLTMAPAVLIGKVSASLFLPLLSRTQRNFEEFERRYGICVELVALVAAAVSIPLIVAGESVVVLIYGQKYLAAGGLMGWLGAMWALRIMRGTPTIAAMALGDTQNSMISNIVRTAALAGVVFVAAAGRPLVWFAICGFLGELAALIFCVWRLQHKHGLDARVTWRPFLASAGAMIVAAVVAISGSAKSGRGAGLSLAAAILLSFSALTFATSPSLRRLIATRHKVVPENVSGALT